MRCRGPDRLHNRGTTDLWCNLSAPQESASLPNHKTLQRGTVVFFPRGPTHTHTHTHTHKNGSADDKCHQPSVRLRHAASVGLGRRTENSTGLKIQLDLLLTKSTRGITASSAFNGATLAAPDVVVVVVFPLSLSVTSCAAFFKVISAGHSLRWRRGSWSALHIVWSVFYNLKVARSGIFHFNAESSQCLSWGGWYGGSRWKSTLGAAFSHLLVVLGFFKLYAGH